MFAYYYSQLLIIEVIIICKGQTRIFITWYYLSYGVYFWVHAIGMAYNDVGGT